MQPLREGRITITWTLNFVNRVRAVRACTKAYDVESPFCIMSDFKHLSAERNWQRLLNSTRRTLTPPSGSIAFEIQPACVIRVRLVTKRVDWRLTAWLSKLRYSVTIKDIISTHAVFAERRAVCDKEATFEQTRSGAMQPAKSTHYTFHAEKNIVRFWKRRHSFYTQVNWVLPCDAISK